MTPNISEPEGETIGTVVTHPDQIEAISTLYRGAERVLRHLNGIPRNWVHTRSAAAHTTGDPLYRLFRVEGATDAPDDQDSYTIIRYTNEIVYNEQGEPTGRLDGRFIEGWGELVLHTPDVPPELTTKIEAYFYELLTGETDETPRELLWRDDRIYSTCPVDQLEFTPEEQAQARSASPELEVMTTIELQRYDDPDPGAESEPGPEDEQDDEQAQEGEE